MGFGGDQLGANAAAFIPFDTRADSGIKAPRSWLRRRNGKISKNSSVEVIKRD